MSSLSSHQKTQRIPILYLNYSMEVGGIETLICEFVLRLKGNGFLPSVCVFKGGGILEKRLESAGVPVYCLEKKEGIDLSLIPKLRRLMKDEKINILHTHNYSPWLYGALASIGLKRVKVVHTEHSNVNNRRRAWAEKALSFFTDRIVCVSGDVKESMISGQGLLPDRLSVIYNGVDTERFYPDIDKKKMFKERFNISQDAVVVGIVARLNPVKDHSTLLKAFKIIFDKVTDAVLVIIGDGELREEIEREINGLGVRGRVLLLGERTDIPELLNMLDVFVLSSLSEGHNMSLLEAMAVGLPVVATNVGGNVEIVDDEKTGFLVPARSPQLLAEKIGMLLQNNGLMSSMGEKSREKVLSLFSVERMIEGYKNVYQRNR